MATRLIVSVADPIDRFVHATRAFGSCPVTVGSAPENALRLAGAGIAPNHGLLSFTSTSVRFFDLAELEQSAAPRGMSVGPGVPLQIGPFNISARIQVPSHDHVEPPVERAFTSMNGGLLSIVKAVTATLRAIPLTNPNTLAACSARAVAILDTASAAVVSLQPADLRSWTRAETAWPTPLSWDALDIADRLIDPAGRDLDLDSLRAHIIDLIRWETMALIPTAQA